MIRLRPPSAHPPDADLVRHLDRQLDLRTSRQLRGHLESCTRCARRLEELERPSRALREALTALPVALPDDGRRALALSAMERARRRRAVLPSRAWILRAAAVAGLVLVVAVSARPSRAWIARGVDRVAVELGIPEVSQWLIGEEAAVVDPAPRRRTTSSPGAAPAPPPAVDEKVVVGRAEPELRRKVRAPPPRESAPVSFTPRGDELVLEFDSYQAEGTLSLWIMDVPSVSAVVVDGRGEGFQGHRGGIRVRNAEASSARYTVVVPQQIREVHIRIAGRTQARIGIEPTGSSHPWLWTVDLQRRGGT